MGLEEEQVPLTVECYTRQGHRVTTTGILEEQIMNFIVPQLTCDMVLDGEICIVREGGLEDFQQIAREFRKKNHTIMNPRYYVFDCVPLENFLEGGWNVSFGNRYHMIQEWFSNIDDGGEDGSDHHSVLKITEQLPCPTMDELMKLLVKVNKKGWEGLMLKRAESIYIPKRTNDTLKLKVMSDAEYMVEDMVSTTINMIMNGSEQPVDCLKSVIIYHNDNTVHVGSGFSHEQRIEFYNHPNLIVGKWITVQYFEETENGKSLKFPTFKGIRDMDK